MIKKMLTTKTVEIKRLKFNCYLYLKKVFDTAFSLVALILLGPIFLLLSLLIKIEDPKGKVIFSQARIGVNGEEFMCLKFKSMYHNAEAMKDQFTEEQKKEFSKNFKLKKDPRVTKVGRILRNSSLDELPQLINILKGEMSLVGPRPITREELDFYKGYEQHFFSCKPGLTGLWQISGRSDTTYSERVLLDVQYALNRSVTLDIKILFLTIFRVLKREGAY